MMSQPVLKCVDDDPVDRFDTVWLLIEQRSFRAPANMLAERIRNLIRIASPGHWHPR